MCFPPFLADLVLSSESEGELYERDGHTYLRLTKFNFEPEIGDMQIYASNLVPDPALSEYMKLRSGKLTEIWNVKIIKQNKQKKLNAKENKKQGQLRQHRSYNTLHK